MRKVEVHDLENALHAIEVAWMHQDVPNEVYYKVLVEIASDYASILVDLETALVLVNRIPEEYFRGVVQEQMVADRLFAEAAIELAYRFSQQLLDEAPYATNQPAAEA